MSSSNLLRLGGLAAMLGAVLLVIVGLVQIVLNLFFSNPGALSEGVMVALYVRSAFGLLGHALLALGLVGLYVRHSEDTGTFGIISFLATFLGMALPVGLGWASVLTDLGWILFGVASLRSGVYPRVAAILLIVGAVMVGVFDHLVAPMVGGPGSTLVYVSVGAEIVRNTAIGWLGYALFSDRTVAVERPQPAR